MLQEKKYNYQMLQAFYFQRNIFMQFTAKTQPDRD